MTHYVKTVHSDKTFCDRIVFEVLRVDDGTTPNLSEVTCPRCIMKIDSIVLGLKNNIPTNGNGA